MILIFEILQEFEDGEILIESEAIKFELRDIKKDMLRTTVAHNHTILGTAMLTNDAEHSNMVETVMSFVYDKVIYWGTCEGVARGLPTEVFENGKRPFSVGWGLRFDEPKTEVCTELLFFKLNINKNLWTLYIDCLLSATVINPIKHHTFCSPYFCGSRQK